MPQFLTAPVATAAGTDGVDVASQPTGTGASIEDATTAGTVDAAVRRPASR